MSAQVPGALCAEVGCVTCYWLGVGPLVDSSIFSASPPDSIAATFLLFQLLVRTARSSLVQVCGCMLHVMSGS